MSGRQAARKPQLLQDFREDDGVRGSRQGVRSSLRSLFTVRGVATVGFRLSQRLGRLWWPLGHLTKQLNHVVTGADLAWQAEVGPGLRLYHPTGVVMGPHVSAGRRLVVQQGVTIGGDGGPGGGVGSSPCLGDDVFLGAGARIIGAITVGDGVVVGANAVVVDDVPSGVTAVGVPAVPRRRPPKTD